MRLLLQCAIHELDDRLGDLRPRRLLNLFSPELFDAEMIKLLTSGLWRKPLPLARPEFLVCGLSGICCMAKFARRKQYQEPFCIFALIGKCAKKGR
jgi:hypothetical protein